MNHTTQRTPATRPVGWLEMDEVIVRVDELLELTYRCGESGRTQAEALSPSRQGRGVPLDKGARTVLQRLGMTGDRATATAADQALAKFGTSAGLEQRLRPNLARHAREVCRSTRPACDDCVLISFCRTGQANARKDVRPVAVELFAGAGGLGTGFAAEGFRVALAVEYEKRAAQTYRLNHPGTVVLEADVTRVSGAMLRGLMPWVAKPAAVIAGPPCQGYSAAGRREPGDEKNALFAEVSRIAGELKARFVAIENVPGMRGVRGVRFTSAVIDELRREGYVAREYLLRASDFGVPQLRRRIVFLAQRIADGDAPGQPQPTHCPEWAGFRCAAETTTCPLPQTPSVLERLGQLPLLGSGEVAEFRSFGGRILTNASTMAHSPSVIEKISQIEPGKGPISYRRLHKDLARTVVAGHRALPVHPTLDRTISVREAALIQGFDETYTFSGPRAAQPLQVANAVPPPMGRAIARELLALL